MPLSHREAYCERRRGPCGPQRRVRRQRPARRRRLGLPLPRRIVPAKVTNKAQVPLVPARFLVIVPVQLMRRVLLIKRGVLPAAWRRRGDIAPVHVALACTTHDEGGFVRHLGS